MIPENLPLLMGLPGMGEVIEKIMRGEGSLEDHLVWLSQPGFRIRVWFSSPVQIRVNGYRTKMVTEHTFAGFFKGQIHGLCYMIKEHARSGYKMGDQVKFITRYEPVLKHNEFKSFEQFRAKFDTRFITESEIQTLWDGTSPQHGGKYRPNDFRKLSRTGLRLMERFLEHFKGVDKVSPFYIDKGDYKILNEHYTSSGRPNSVFGRDISISHQTNLSFVSYSSEYPGCGNGRYGILANKKEYLHIEDD